MAKTTKTRLWLHRASHGDEQILEFQPDEPAGAPFAKRAGQVSLRLMESFPATPYTQDVDYLSPAVEVVEQAGSKRTYSSASDYEDDMAEEQDQGKSVRSSRRGDRHANNTNKKQTHAKSQDQRQQNHAQRKEARKKQQQGGSSGRTGPNARGPGSGGHAGSGTRTDGGQVNGRGGGGGGGGLSESQNATHPTGPLLAEFSRRSKKLVSWSLLARSTQK